MSKNVTIVGAGLIGSLMSVFLAKKGYVVDVFEKRPDPRISVMESGRSINMALSNRGIKALKEVGLDQLVLNNTVPMKGRMIHDEEGQVHFQPYGEEGEMIYSVSRGQLNKLLMEKADEYENVHFHFNHRCLDPVFDKNQIAFQKGENGEIVHHDYSVLIGADGAFSAVRTAMMKTDRFNYAQEYLEHGYLELTIPAKNGKHVLDKNALHIWPRHTYMLIALPNMDGSFTATLFLPFQGEVSFEALSNGEKVMAFFQKHFPDVVPLIPDLIKDYYQKPPSSLLTVKAYPWTCNHNALLIGDAAHAIVPFYGQGMNAGFEDCYTLNGLLEESGHDWAASIKLFEQVRKQDADAIAELALRNFIEMRDKVADAKFLLRKKIEGLIHQKLGKRYLPLYTMVTFSDMSYSEALRLGNHQDEIMNNIMATPGIEQLWDKEDFWHVIEKQVEELYQYY
ncbi:MAG TPA: NAD(P)/FAD-dependent oxidoreductase [Cytophagaceae bacterium]